MKITVVGGGISGVSAAYLLSQNTKNSVVLVEKEKYIGGKAGTVKDEGYLIETGPNGFLDNKKEILNLIEESGFEDNVILSKDESRKRYIFSRNRLWQLPESPAKFLINRFLSTKGKIRILKEPFIKPFYQDETLDRFVTRRLGKEFLDKLIGPMSCGVYAGNPKYMSMNATFKKIKDIEIKYSSLIKGLIAMMREKKANTKSASGPFSAKLLSFKDGVGSFINHLSKNIDTVNDEVIGISKYNQGYRIIGKDKTIESDIVVFAVPSYSLSGIISSLDEKLSKDLNNIPYAPLSVVSLGFEKKNMPDVVNSFGYLFDLNSIEDVIGVLFDSSIFDFRSGSDKLLSRVVIGGGVREKSAFKKNQVSIALKELQRSAGIFQPFEYSKVVIHKKAIPQYGLNHKTVLDKIQDFENRHRGIFITGNAFYGVSLNDCIKSSYNILKRI